MPLADPISGALQPTPLLNPELTIVTNNDGSITVSAHAPLSDTWATGCTGLILQIDDESSFSGGDIGQRTILTPAPVTISIGSVGQYYVRAKFLGNPNAVLNPTADSFWSAVSTVNIAGIKLDTPVFTATPHDSYLQISNLNVVGALGYKYKLGATAQSLDTVFPSTLPQDGKITGLTPATTYYLCIIATASESTYNSDWSTPIATTTSVTLPTATCTSVTSDTATLSTSYSTGLAEIRLGTTRATLSTSSTRTLPIVGGCVTLRDLRPNCTYFCDARYSTDAGQTWSARCSVVVLTTQDFGATSKADRLRWIRRRILLLREALSNPDSLTSVSVDGITESWTSRDQLSKELATLEQEESRLMSGGGRIRQVDLTRVL